MDLDAIAVFVKVVQAGSFSQAARLLGMPNTTVSAKVARLEKDLGITLIRRTTRKLYVTPAGQAFFARCMRGLAEIETAQAEITSARTEPCGLLRISVAGDVGHSLLPLLLTRFLRKYPAVKVDLIVTNRTVDLVGEGVDLAIRAGELKDSSLVVRKFLPITGGLWASAAYLSQRGRPRTPSDLEKHDCLVFARFDLRRLKLTDAGHTVDVPLKDRIVVDDLETLRELAALGNGIAPLPDFLVGERDGAKLERVLPRWSWTRGALSFVYPSQQFVPPNVRAFIDLALATRKDEKRG
jgi:DNA-binding transcriptional LysR family regulator